MYKLETSIDTTIVSLPIFVFSKKLKKSSGIFYLQVFFSFSFHQIEDLRCSNCISHGTKHSSLQIEP